MKIFCIVALILASGLLAKAAERSALYQAFDVGATKARLEKKFGRITESSGQSGFTISFASSSHTDEFKKFQIQGEITDAGVDALLRELKEELIALAKQSGVNTDGTPAPTVADRPIYVVQTVIGLADATNLRGFYFFYHDGRAFGAVDVFATKKPDREGQTVWKVACAVHEPANKAEQDSADQAATAPESKPEGGDKPEPERRPQ